MSISSDGLTRREFLRRGSKVATGAFGVVLAACSTQQTMVKSNAAQTDARMQFGLVTYLWGKDWDLPQLIRNCETAGLYGVELRVEHAHHVSPALNARQRYEVKLRFQNSPVNLVGFGTNYAFHYTDPKEVQQNLEDAKAYVRLSHDVGGTGVKVKPNGLPDGVPVEKTTEQIGNALNDLGEYANSFGQEIRVEVHGSKTQRLPIMKQIFDHVTQPNVGMCWNCNDTDLDGKGLESNFNLVKDRLGDTVHVRELNIGDYPYQELMNLFVKNQYHGWILLEARTNPGDRIKAMAQQKQVFRQMVQKAS